MTTTNRTPAPSSDAHVSAPTGTAAESVRKTDVRSELMSGVSSEAIRRYRTALHGPAAPPTATHKLERAQRSSREVKRIAALDSGPGQVGDGAPALRAAAAGPATLDVALTTSPPAALYLKDLTLNRSFNLFQRTNQIYVSAISWDLSGKPPQLYPPVEVADAAWQPPVMAMKPNETVKFLGEGIQLWPPQPIKGGLYVQLVVMESDDDLRKLGAKIKKVRRAIEQSELASVLTTLGGAVTGGKLVAVEQAARALSRVVEVILQENKDDHVATFQGTYGAEGIRAPRTERYDRRGASITLNLNPVRDTSTTLNPTR